jgi:hypothetical protein
MRCGRSSGRNDGVVRAARYFYDVVCIFDFEFG